MDPIDTLLEIIDTHVPVDSPDYDLAMDAVHNLIAMDE
jgi:hypothetical protein